MSVLRWSLALVLGLVSTMAFAQAGELGSPDQRAEPAFGDDFDVQPEAEPAPTSGEEGEAEVPASETASDEAAEAEQDLEEAEHDLEEAEPWDPWRGPRVEIAYSHYSLTDGHGGGAVHAGQFGGAYTFGRLRLGAYGEFGIREYALGPDDLVARASALIGYQHLPAIGNHLIPFAVVEGTAGAVFGKRFSTARADALYGLGLRVGVDLRIVRTLWIGLSLGYLRARVGDVADNLWNVRVRLGL